MSKLVLALGLCIAAVVVETILAGNRPANFLRSLRQPKWALPPAVWYLVGGSYYALCFLSLYRLSSWGPPQRSPAFWLIVILMASNAGWNWLFFRQRNLRLAYLFFFPYSLLAIAVVAALLQVDRLSGMVFAIYLIYLPYALAWSFQVWRLNGSVPKLGGSQDGMDKSN